MLLCFCSAVLGQSGTPEKAVLDWGRLVIRIPHDLRVMKHRVNFETDEYVVARRSDGRELLRIIVGGGAYDLERYKPICLNHKKAWRLASPHRTQLVVGEPGVNAVSASYENLSSENADIAGKVMKSIDFHDGRSC